MSRHEQYFHQDKFDWTTELRSDIISLKLDICWYLVSFHHTLSLSLRCKGLLLIRFVTFNFLGICIRKPAPSFIRDSPFRYFWNFLNSSGVMRLPNKNRHLLQQLPITTKNNGHVKLNLSLTLSQRKRKIAQL